MAKKWSKTASFLGLKNRFFGFSVEMEVCNLKWGWTFSFSNKGTLGKNYIVELVRFIMAHDFFLPQNLGRIPWGGPPYGLKAPGRRRGRRITFTLALWRGGIFCLRGKFWEGIDWWWSPSSVNFTFWRLTKNDLSVDYSEFKFKL